MEVDGSPDFFVGDGTQMPRLQYLAGFDDPNYVTVASTVESAPPSFDGNLADLEKQFPETSHFAWNDVKACGCGKPCAYTMTTCNACGASLEEVPISKSDNVFAAFVFGVKSAQKGFPYKISMRRETADVLCFDDMLALTPCHLNGISKRYYIPDCRYLMLNPSLGLKLLDELEQELMAATAEFCMNEEWKKQTFKDPSISIEEIGSKVIKSFNFPPSQFQLHIQWLVPPLAPFQHYMAEIGNHFHKNRAIPMTYMRAVLKWLKDNNKKWKVTKDTPIEDIFNFFNSKGINYLDMWNEFYQKALQDSMELANWNPSSFKYVVEEKKAYNFTVDGDKKLVKGDLQEGVDLTAVQKDDCAKLQNYGRPYTEDGKSSGTYVKRPLEPKIGEGGWLLFEEGPEEELTFD
mmetsp:Transcript_7415/g.16346  ORF Transcript_7415/g.16346 Transcript_7415/m.16346 type:complete len:405 (+) Transcript_7415:150-1364(+)